MASRQPGELALVPLRVPSFAAVVVVVAAAAPVPAGQPFGPNFADNMDPSYEGSSS